MESLMTASNQKEPFKKYANDHKKTYKSKLRDLVDKYKIFQHPEKIDHLRREKMNEAYGASKVD